MRRKSALVATLLMLLVQGAAHADPLKIRIGYQSSPDTLVPFLLDRQDIAPNLHRAYDIELVHFQASSVQISALASGQTDVSLLGYSTFGIAIENAKLDDLRLVADFHRDGMPGHLSNSYVVLKDGPIHRIEDLKGKVLATNGMGSASDIPMRYMLKQHGLLDKRDYSAVEVAPPNMYSMLIAGKADLVSKVPTTMRDPDQIAHIRTLFDARQAFGVTEFSFFCARASFLDGNRVQLAAFFDDLVRIARWYAAPAHRDEAVKMLAGVLHQPVDETASYYLLPDQDTYRDPDAHPDPAALQRNLDAMQAVGFLSGHIDVAKHTDLSFIEGAAKRLGPRT